MKKIYSTEKDKKWIKIHRKWAKMNENLPKTTKSVKNDNIFGLFLCILSFLMNFDSFGCFN